MTTIGKKIQDTFFKIFPLVSNCCERNLFKAPSYEGDRILFCVLLEGEGRSINKQTVSLLHSSFLSKEAASAKRR
jgi:hypothetical protein